MHYYLIDPSTQKTHWVGSTNWPARRLGLHIYKAKNPKVSNNSNPQMNKWVLSVQPLKPILRIVCVVETEREAVRIEEHLTRTLRARGEPLCNINYGQRVTNPSFLGKTHTKQTRALMSKSATETWSKDHASRGGGFPAGGHHSRETKRQISLSGQAAWTPERREAARQRMIERNKQASTGAKKAP